MHHAADPCAREQYPEYERGHGGDEDGAVPVQSEPGQEADQHGGERGNGHGVQYQPMGRDMEDIPPAPTVVVAVSLTIRLCQAGQTIASRRSGDQSSSGYQVQSWSSSSGMTPTMCQRFCDVRAAPGWARTILPRVARTILIGMLMPMLSAAARMVEMAISPPQLISTAMLSASKPTPAFN